MVIGQLLLLAFIVLWLRSQYKQTEFELDKDLERAFSESTKELQDTILKTRFVDPLIESRSTGQSRTMTMQYEFRTQTDTFLGLNVDEHPTILQPITYAVEDSSGHVETRLHRTFSVEDSSSDILADVVTIFFDEIKQEGDTAFKLYLFDDKGDSTLHKILREKLEESNLKVDHIIEYKREKFQPVNHFTFNSEVFGNNFQVQYDGFRKVIWLRILPQILFSVLLFRTIGAAFYFLYRNLQTQMQLYSQQSQFVANVSHELRTPISTVKVAFESIKSHAGSRDENLAREYMSMASSELDRLENIVSDVLQNSLMEGGALKLNRENNDLTECVRHSMMVFKSSHESNVVIVELKTDEEVRCSFDEIHVQGIILNLLDNARKYGGSRIIIDISMNELSQSIILSIQDNGPGIPEEYKDKIFERFFRVPTGDVHDVKGYGLGLTYCRQVMRLHGGDLNLTSNSPGSTTFQLEFPRK
jgi:signal transduction histidine kinase